MITASCLSRMASKGRFRMGMDWENESKSVLSGSRKLYTEAAEEIRVRNGRERNPQAKELLADIERSFQRLAEMARCTDELTGERKYDRPFVSFGFFRGGC